ncbi:hypothetical protein D3C86_2030570 [compost metagenome]
MVPTALTISAIVARCTKLIWSRLAGLPLFAPMYRCGLAKDEISVQYFRNGTWCSPTVVGCTASLLRTRLYMACTASTTEL